MKRENSHLKWRALISSAITIILILTAFAPVFAADKDGDIPPDPGVGSEQDSTKSNSVKWVLPFGFTYFIDDEDGNIELDWSNVDLASTTAPVEGIIPLTGLGSGTEVQTCGQGNGLGGCQTQYVPGGDALFYPEDLTPELLGFPQDTGASGYQNDCDKPSNNCEKKDSGVENGGTFWPSNNPDVVVIKAGQGQFFYIPRRMACSPETMAYCVTWNGDGSITVVRYGSGPTRKEISNIQFWNTGHDLVPEPEPVPVPGGYCPDVWVSPGVITVTAGQIAPSFALVVGQDLQENGVTLEWSIRVDPTVVNYQKWEVVDYNVTACVENDPNGNQYREGYGHDEEWPNGGYQYRYGCGHNNCGCPDGWHPIVEEIYGCQDYFKSYPEEIGDLNPGASLKLNSRAWIEGELAAAYPGAHLINPDWTFDTPPQCVWDGDVCTMDFTLVIPATDPGWYDIKLEGQTAGTLASPPRSFEVVAGQFGVYLIDSSLVAQ